MACMLYSHVAFTSMFEVSHFMIEKVFLPWFVFLSTLINLDLMSAKFFLIFMELFLHSILYRFYICMLYTFRGTSKTTVSIIN